MFFRWRVTTGRIIRVLFDRPHHDLAPDRALLAANFTSTAKAFLPAKRSSGPTTVNLIKADGTPKLPLNVLGSAGPDNDAKAFTILGGTLTHEGKHNLQMGFLTHKGPVSMLSTLHKEFQAYELAKGYYGALGSGAIAPDPKTGAWESTREACRKVGCNP